MELHPSLMTAGQKFNAEKGQLGFITELETVSVTQPQRQMEAAPQPPGSKTRGGLQRAQNRAADRGKLVFTIKMRHHAAPHALISILQTPPHLAGCSASLLFF